MSYDDWKTTEPLPDQDYCPGCGFTRCACGDEPEVEREPEPDYNYTPYEESASYRESMIDAGRGHLLR